MHVLALGVQRVGGDHQPGQVQAGQRVQQWSERGDLVGLAVHRDLPEHDSRVVIDHRAQMPCLSVPVGVIGSAGAGAAHGLAVHREHPPPLARSAGRAQSLDEPADQRVEPAPSKRCTTRRIVDSHGPRPVIPSASATSAGRSATHSEIATNDRDPAATAHTATVITTTSRWRTPRGLRGSTNSASTSCNRGASATWAPVAPAS